MYAGILNHQTVNWLKCIFLAKTQTLDAHKKSSGHSTGSSLLQKCVKTRLRVSLLWCHDFVMLFA